MNSLRTALIVLLFLCSGAAAQDTLRIMSYNIRNCRGIDGVCDIRRTADIIKKSRADIIALQEVDSATRRSGGIFIADTLATLCNMRACFSAAIEYDGGKYGVAILSKEPPAATRSIALPGREEPRTLLLAEFPRLTFACTHLSLNADDRLASLAIIDSTAKASAQPFVVAGDLNDHPQSPFIKIMLTNWLLLSPADRPTFPADRPTATIDYIATLHDKAQSIRVSDTRVLDEPAASDHRPILTTIIVE